MSAPFAAYIHRDSLGKHEREKMGFSKNYWQIDHKTRKMLEH